MLVQYLLAFIIQLSGLSNAEMLQILDLEQSDGELSDLCVFDDADEDIVKSECNLDQIDESIVESVSEANRVLYNL